MRCILPLILLTLSLALPPRAQAEEMPQPVTVFAAASLRDAVTEIAESFPAEVTLSFAGSGTLARQIAAGAPADVVILAHRDWAAWMTSEGLILDSTLTEVAGGQLVVIGAPDAATLTAPDAPSLLAALDGGRLAMGQRDGVPAGSYAREWLTQIGAWDALLPALAETDNVRAALALVAQGAAPLGVVYASDALAEPRVRVIYSVPAGAHSPIRYPAAAVTDAGRAFITHLTRPEAAAIFASHGFAP
jgi:molybdate transport system substrate-binding protein